MRKIKIPIIEHESFIPLLQKKPDIFRMLFAENKNGILLHKFGTLMNRINTICEKLMPDFADLYRDEENAPGSGLNHFKGDVFEIFINGFLLICGVDARVAVKDYTPERKIKDWGVDGFGLGNDDSPLTVQVKFRSNAKHLLTQNELGQFAFQSYAQYNVEVHSNNLVLITSCKGLNPITASQVFLNKIREINGETIKNIVDDNYIFWDTFLRLIDNTIKVKSSPDQLFTIGLMNTELVED